MNSYFLSFLKGEIDSLNLICDDENQLCAIERDVVQALFDDDYIGQSIQNIIDDVIFDYELPSIDEPYD